MEENNPLVSVTVITYNSAKTVLDTLESIRLQSYPKLELVISDDCSQDETVSICQKWIADNKDRFVRVELMTVEHNTGIAANCNRAQGACFGEWQKGIAGDDILLPNCISDFVSFIDENPEAEIVVGKQRIYWDTFDEDNYYRSTTAEELGLLDSDPFKQRDAICNNGVIFAPAVFKKMDLNEKLPKYDEKYLMEDYPYYIRLLSMGIRLYYLDKEVVGYRKSSMSVTAVNDKLFNYRMAKAVYQVERELCFDFFSFGRKMRTVLTFALLSFYEHLGFNKRKKINFVTYRFVRKIIDNFG